jgi:ribosomal protein S18 acetylase RimI-like enzyme
MRLARTPGGADSDLELRDARADELAEVAELLREVYGVFWEHFPRTVWKSYITEIVDVRARLDESELIVAECDGHIAGTITFYPQALRSAIERWPQGWASIRTLGVLAPYRRRGIGEALSRECVRRARAYGNEAIGLHTASYLAAATRLYGRLRFRRAPEFDVEIGEMFAGRPLPSGESWQALAYRLDLREVKP